MDWQLVNLMSVIPEGPAFHTSLTPARGYKCEKPVLGDGGEWWVESRPVLDVQQ